MNITADPGLLYNMSELFTMLNITKNKNPSIWSRNPSILSINTKDDTFIIFVLKPSKNPLF